MVRGGDTLAGDVHIQGHPSLPIKLLTNEPGSSCTSCFFPWVGYFPNLKGLEVDHAKSLGKEQVRKASSKVFC